ncbi:chaperone for protein-folding within the ER, fungal-domain-containing protein, partial [Lineolata rhizophorae]
QLTGTWSTKSNKTLTGPGFYDPVNEEMFEPDHTGISYSFTDDGYFEEAYYRAIANPVNPACPSAIMQWQHGTFEKHANGSLTLTPIAVDGRQLLSEPCKYDEAIYTRYNVTELFEKYQVYVDPYHNVLRLDLYKFDGSPMHPMYLVYKPPKMLPTQTLNPTATASGAASAGETGDAKRMGRRSVGGLEIDEELVLPLNRNVVKKRSDPVVNADRWWWFGVALTGFGGILYFCF